jgi:hypothetical protein
VSTGYEARLTPWTGCELFVGFSRGGDSSARLYPA